MWERRLCPAWWCLLSGALPVQPERSTAAGPPVAQLQQGCCLLFLQKWPAGPQAVCALPCRLARCQATLWP